MKHQLPDDESALTQGQPDRSRYALLRRALLGSTLGLAVASMAFCATASAASTPASASATSSGATSQAAFTAGPAALQPTTTSSSVAINCGTGAVSGTVSVQHVHGNTTSGYYNGELDLYYGNTGLTYAYTDASGSATFTKFSFTPPAGTTSAKLSITPPNVNSGIDIPVTVSWAGCATTPKVSGSGVRSCPSKRVSGTVKLAGLADNGLYGLEYGSVAIAQFNASATGTASIPFNLTGVPTAAKSVKLTLVRPPSSGVPPFSFSISVANGNSCKPTQSTSPTTVTTTDPGSASRSTGPVLANTGSPNGETAAVGASLLALGCLLLFVGRRRIAQSARHVR